MYQLKRNKLNVDEAFNDTECEDSHFSQLQMRTTQTVKPKGCVLSKSARSGLIFPVARILRYMKQGNAFRSKRVATKASVYLSAVIEYVTSKIILQLISAGELSELAGVHAQRDRKKIISPRHIMFAVANDDELFKVNFFL